MATKTKKALKPAKKSTEKPAKTNAKKPVKRDLKEAKRTYHVSKRKEDGKWQVKFAGGEKAIKLFATQEEALKYTKEMAANQDGSILVHASKGAQKGKIKKK